MKRTFLMLFFLSAATRRVRQYLTASEGEAQQLTYHIAKDASNIIRATIKTRGLDPEEQEDLHQLVQMQLWKHINEMRKLTLEGEEPKKQIDNFSVYVAKMSSNAISHILKQKNPLAERMLSSIKLAANLDPWLASWKIGSGELRVFGLMEWKDEKRHIISRKLSELMRSPHSTLPSPASPKKFLANEIIATLHCLFTTTTHPVSHMDVLNIFSSMYGIPSRPLSFSELIDDDETESKTAEWLENNSADTLIRIEAQETLVLVWEATKTLTRLQRLIFLLTCDSQNSVSLVRELWRIGVPEAELSEKLEVSLQEFPELLPRLPLSFKDVSDRQPFTGNNADSLSSLKLAAKNNITKYCTMILDGQPTAKSGV
jgi:hypothetical protein